MFPIPKQIEDFDQWEIWDELDRNDKMLSVKKNKDYSPFNILATGEIGVVIRLADKFIRLANLYGLDLQTGKWTEPKEPLNESIEDTLTDIRNYSRIMALLRRDKWGK